jgi:outer membrane protein assembly factor BamD (BamD/ComL family)
MRGSIWVVLLASALLGVAPAQCGEPEPIQYARRDDPAETVYRLGERLRDRGHDEAARDTWEFLVEQYPSSRWSEKARVALEREPAPAPAPSAPTRAPDAAP